MTEFEKQIDYWSSSLAKRLVEIRFIDLDEMKAAMKAHLKSAMMDCIKVQLIATEQKLVDKKLHYAKHGGGKNNHIQSEIISLRRKLKEENKLYAELDVENQNKELILWMRRFNEKSLLDFYADYRKRFPTPLNKNDAQRTEP